MEGVDKDDPPTVMLQLVPRGDSVKLLNRRTGEIVDVSQHGCRELSFSDGECWLVDSHGAEDEQPRPAVAVDSLLTKHIELQRGTSW